MANGASVGPPASHAVGTAVDLHIHTVRGAADSDLQPADLAAEARRIGLAGVNISEHDRAWDTAEFEAFREQSGLFLSRGMEVSTDMGHIIVVGIDRYHAGIRSARRLREVCDEIGAVMSVAPSLPPLLRPRAFPAGRARAVPNDPPGGGGAHPGVPVGGRDRGGQRRQTHGGRTSSPIRWRRCWANRSRAAPMRTRSAALASTPRCSRRSCGARRRCSR